MINGFSHSSLAIVVGLLAIGGDDADAQLSMVIGALLGLALVIAAVTVIYWRMTKPDPASGRARTTASEETVAAGSESRRSSGSTFDDIPVVASDLAAMPTSETEEQPPEGR